MERSRKGVVLSRGPHTVDHLALGTSHLETGMQALEAATGAEGWRAAPEPGAWYQSGALALEGGSFLELIAPAPGYRGFQPLRATLAGLQGLRPLFWYVATDDFGAFAERAREAGAPVERVEHPNRQDDPAHGRYVRGVLGPGFLSQRPCVIEWQRRAARDAPAPRCALAELRLSHPEAAALTAPLAALGIRERVTAGPSALEILLDSPRGRVSFAGPGLDFRGLRGLATFLKLGVAHALTLRGERRREQQGPDEDRPAAR
jgi:hypothetical protein